MSGSSDVTRFAKKRFVKIPGHADIRTPLLVPSFSSKGFGKIDDLWNASQQFIGSEVLVSAYDISRKHLTVKIDGPPLIILDSGGYEASKDKDLSDYFDALGEAHQGELHDSKDWTREEFDAVVAGFSPAISAVLFVSFDTPKLRRPIVEQIADARSTGGTTRQIAREILLKPHSQGSHFLNMKELLARVEDLAQFEVIGVTEKEIGNSIIDRMANICKLRAALEREGLQTPIHVFGSLDTLSTILYFVMGADIFDGLTWLRYAYHQGSTIYRHEQASKCYAASMTEAQILERMRTENYYYLQQMTLDLQRFLSTGDFECFEWNVETIKKLYDLAIEKAGER